MKLHYTLSLGIFLSILFIACEATNNNLIKNSRFGAWIDLVLFSDLKIVGSKVQIDLDTFDGIEICCDEILINPKY